MKKCPYCGFITDHETVTPYALCSYCGAPVYSRKELEEAGWTWERSLDYRMAGHWKKVEE